jgi:molecular chaperone DnaJ
MGGVTSAARDFYDVLGVPSDADAATIKRAFRARARECHPDVATALGAPERFRELAKAYDVLSTPNSRLLYDRFGYRGPGNGGFEVRESCAACGGEGVRRVEPKTCPRCGGLGRVKQVSALEAARLLRLDTCPDCAGSGRVVSEACVECGGAGEVRIRPFDFEPRVAEGLRRVPDDPRLVQYGAALGLLAALAFLALLLFG